MTTATLFGSLFIAFGLPFALYVFVVSKSPKLIVISVSSAFAWLISLLCAAIVWNMVLPLKEESWWSVFLAVPFQELFRFLFWMLLKKAENGMNILGEDNGHVITREKVAFGLYCTFLMPLAKPPAVAGIGFGSMSVAINFNIALSASGGPGSLPAPGCLGVSFFAISATIALVFGILNALWSVVAHSGFEGIRKEGLLTMGTFKVVFVIVGHYFASFLTLNNEDGSCAATLVPLYVLAAITALVAYRISGVSFASK